MNKKPKVDVPSKCQYCGRKAKNKNSNTNHELKCSQNPNPIEFKSGFIEYNKKVKNGEIKKKNTNQYTKAKNEGKEYILNNNARKNMSDARTGKSLSEPHKNNISHGIQEAVKKYPESYNSCNVNGRVKKYNYNGIMLDGKWELEVAKWFDNNHIQWVRNKTGFSYIWKEKNKIYYPDFYLPKQDLYIEVKGYQRDRDLAKWEALDNLIIMKEKEIIAIRKNRLPKKFLQRQNST